MLAFKKNYIPIYIYRRMTYIFLHFITSAFSPSVQHMPGRETMPSSIKKNILKNRRLACKRPLQRGFSQGALGMVAEIYSVIFFHKYMASL